MILNKEPGAALTLIALSVMADVMVWCSTAATGHMSLLSLTV